MKPRAPPPARRGASAPPSVWGAWLVSVVATFLALGVPGVTFSVGYSALSSSLQTKVDVKAQVIQQAIVMSPEMWRFEEHRLEELLTRVPAELHDDVMAACRSALADFKVPREIRFVDDMPRSTLEKVAKAELRKMLG